MPFGRAPGEGDAEMGSLELGTLEPADLREAWKHEAHDFTPWLAEHLNHLGDAIGIEPEHESSEQRVGPYRADIVARDPTDDSRVLIENQLEDANLQHLGQVLAYLAGLEAKVVVWIATAFDDAHLSAIRWLNDHTEDPYAFLAVRIGVVRIGDSPLAPVFEVLEHPNGWNRRVKGEARREGLSELGRFRRDFWNHVHGRHLGEVRPGYAGSNVDRRVEEADLRISLYVAAEKVGVFLGGNPSEPEDALQVRIDPYREPLRAALGGEELGRWAGTALKIETSDRANWDRMADWLHDRRVIYERVLRGAET